jgi:2-phosphosulfolactate phosphatase
VQVFSDIGLLMQQSEQWPEDKRLRAGERGGAKVEGCELGNSPLDCTSERVQGRRLFISTTNGTRALRRIQDAPVVLASALVNRKATVQYAIEQQPEMVWLVGSGWQGNYSLEDTVCAGAIAQSLSEELGVSLEVLAGNDEVVGALALYNHWQDRLLEMFHYASHGKRLLRLDGHEDLKYCSQTDTLDVLPMQKEPGVLISH